MFYTYLMPPIVACIYYWSKCLDPDYKMTPYIRNNMVIDYQNNCLLQPLQEHSLQSQSI